MTRDLDDNGTDEELAELRRNDEVVARRVLREMAASPKTPATARVAAARTLLTDAATRRHDPDPDEKELWQLSAAELNAKIQHSERRLALLKVEAIDVEFEEIPSADNGVFG